MTPLVSGGSGRPDDSVKRDGKLLLVCVVASCAIALCALLMAVMS